MWPVSSRYLNAIRGSHAKVCRAAHANAVTGESTVLDVLDGSVTIDANSNIRRRLDLTVPASETTWQALDTVGGEITVSRGVRYTDGTVEWVPLGVFIVDTDSIDYSGGGTITVSSAPDRWGKVQKNKLPPSGRASVASNMAWQEIQRLVEGAWPSAAYPFPGWAQLDTSATTKVGWLLWDDGDREAAINALTTANSLEVFFDAQGLAVLRPVPVLTPSSTSVWTLDAGAAGVLLTADRTRDRTRTYNAVIVSTSAPDIEFVPVEVKNTDVSDPLNVNGPLGYQAREYSSPVLRNSAQARAAGLTLLGKYVGAAKELTLTAVQNDALDASDVISAILPKIDRNTARPVELHIIDALRVPLRVDDGSALEIQTRSTIPDTLDA